MKAKAIKSLCFALRRMENFLLAQVSRTEATRIRLAMQKADYKPFGK